MYEYTTLRRIHHEGVTHWSGDGIRDLVEGGRETRTEVDGATTQIALSVMGSQGWRMIGTTGTVPVEFIFERECTYPVVPAEEPVARKATSGRPRGGRRA